MTIEKPEVVLAETVAVMSLLESLEPEPFASQFQATSVPVFVCPQADACYLTVNPSVPNAVTP